LSSRPPFFHNWQGASVEDGAVWFEASHSDSVRALAVNVRAWEIAGVPCSDRRIERRPAFSEGTWKVSSLFEVYSEKRADTTWKRVRRRAFRIVGERVQSAWPVLAGCRVDHYAVFDPEQWGALRGTPSFHGLHGSYAEPRALVLKCPGAGHLEHVQNELWLLRNDRIAVEADEHILVFRKVAEPHASPSKVVELGDDCSSAATVCADGLFCKAEQLGDSPALRERCSKPEAQ
jgi:hypothetical protein